MSVTTGVQNIIAAKNREYRPNKNQHLILETNNFRPFQSNPRINASKLKHLIVSLKINLNHSLDFCFCTRSVQLLECHKQPKFDLNVTIGVQNILAAKKQRIPSKQKLQSHS